MDRSTIRELQAIREAEEYVRPVAGAVLGMDSVSGVYAEALKQLGYDQAQDISDSKALKFVFDNVKGRRRSPQMALDGISSKSLKSFKELFPNSVPLKSGY